eukprot:COSAG02_NODE_6117_length_3788_cov_77.670371_2_plen_224_part_00
MCDADYWTYEVGSCPNPSNTSEKMGIVDLWEGKLGGGEGPAHDRVGVSQDTCPYYQEENRTDCQYEDTVFTDFVLDVIRNTGSDNNEGKPLFFCWTPHIVHSPLEVPAAYLAAFDWTGGRAAGGPAWNRQQYMAMVSYLDASIANVTTLLKIKGMWNDTLIVCACATISTISHTHRGHRLALTPHSLVAVSADNGGPIYWSGVGGGEFFRDNLLALLALQCHS